MRSIAVASALAMTLASCASLTLSTRATPSEVQRADSAVRAALRGERSIDVTSLPSRAIAIAPFSFAMRDPAYAPLSYGLADLLATDLAKSSQLAVVERLNIAFLLRELALVNSGRVDTNTAPRIGKLLGARRIITGNIGELPDGSASLRSTVTDVATSERRPGANARGLVDQILDAEKQLALGLFDALGVNLTPAERVAVEEHPTKNLGALLAYSRAVQSEVAGDFENASAEYRLAAALDPSFTAAQAQMQASATRAREFRDMSSARQRAREGPQRAMSLASEGVNPFGGGAADATNPAFAGARGRLTIVILIDIP